MEHQISDEQFESGLDDTPTRILNFLKDRKGTGAYDITGIITGIGWQSRDVLTAFTNYWVVNNILTDLIKKGLVEVKTINRKEYYRIK